MNHTQVFFFPCPHCDKLLQISIKRCSFQNGPPEDTAPTVDNEGLGMLQKALVDDCQEKDILHLLENEVLARRIERTNVLPLAQQTKKLSASPTMRCSYCTEPIQILFETRIFSVTKGEEIRKSEREETLNNSLLPESIVNSNGRTLSLPEQKVIRQCMDGDIFKGLEEAIEVQMQNGTKPRNTYHYFLNLLKNAQKGWPKSDLFGRLKEQFPESQIEFWSGSDIGIILLNGAIFRFVPMKLMKPNQHTMGKSLAHKLGAVSKKEAAEPLILEGWAKSRRGYVPFDTPIFLTELRKRSVGAFDNT